MNVNNVNSAYNNQLAGTSTFYNGDPTVGQLNAAWQTLYHDAITPQEVVEVQGEEARWRDDPTGQPTAQYSITGTLLVNAALYGVDPFQSGPNGMPVPDGSNQISFQQSVQNMVSNANQTVAEKVAVERAKEAAKQAMLLGQNPSDPKIPTAEGISLIN
jgi:hypothetical protein